MTEDPTEVRLIVANVAHTVFQGPGGSETYSGTKHFSAGTRAHVADAYWGDAGAAAGPRPTSSTAPARPSPASPSGVSAAACR